MINFIQNEIIRETIGQHTATARIAPTGARTQKLEQ